MKKSIIYIATALFLVISTFVFINIPEKSDNAGNSSRLPDYLSPDGDGETITKERQEYRFKRLRDPGTGKIPQGIRSRELNFVNKMRSEFQVKSGAKLQSVDWTRRGPAKIGGRTRALAFDVRDENIILAGGVSGGMWRSTDAGTTWIRVSAADQLQSVSTITQDIRPGHEDTWYYGTGELWGNSADISGDGLFKSTDNGKSWSPVEGTFTSRPNTNDNKFDYVWRVRMDHTANNEEGVLYAATGRGGIYRSIDGGKEWTAVLGRSGNGTSYFTDIAVSETGVLYATLSNYYSQSEHGGIYRSENGLEWENITPEAFPEKYCRIIPAIAPSNENIVYFVAETPGSGKWTTNSRGDDMYHSFFKYTYISGNGLEPEEGTWENRSDNLPRPDLTRGHMNSQRSYNLCLAVKPDNPDVVFLGAVTFYRANDAFETPDNWDWIGGTCPWDDCDYHYRYPNHHADNHTILFQPSDDNILFTGSDGGVHKTVDCMAETVEWISLNDGYYTTQFYCVALDHGTEGSELLVGGMQDNGSITLFTSDPEEQEGVPSRGDGFWNQIPDGGKYVYTSQNTTPQPKIKIFRTEMFPDGVKGTTTRIDPLGGKDFIWNTPFVLDPNDNNKMYVAGGRIIWRNNDLSSIPEGGEVTEGTAVGWDSLAETRVGPPNGQEKITAVEVSRTPADILYYGTDMGRVFRVDNAASETPVVIDVSSKDFSGGAYVGCIATDPDDAFKAIAVFTNYGVLSLFATEDGGENWEQVSGNLEEYENGSGVGPATQWLEIIKDGNERTYLCGTSAGVFVTQYLNGPGTVWQAESPDLIGNMAIDVIDSRQSDKYTIVGSHGGGIFASNYDISIEVPETVSPVFPKNNTGGIRSSSTFKWEKSGEVVTYDIRISEKPDFSEVFAEYKGLKNDTVRVESLEQGLSKYYWQVRCVNAGGPSDYSEVFSFETACAAPELEYPEKVSKGINPDKVTFRWKEVEGATSYRLLIAANFAMTQIVVDDTLSSTSANVDWILQENGRYFWKVAAINEYGSGEFSDMSNFSTGMGSAVFDKTRNELFVYPVPAEDFVKLEFDIDTPETISFVIRDSKGRLVHSGDPKFYWGGSRTIEIPVHGFTPGVYFLNSVSSAGKSMRAKFIVKGK